MKKFFFFQCMAVIVVIISLISCKKSSGVNCDSLETKYSTAWGSWNLNPTPTNCSKCKAAIINYLNSDCVKDAAKRQQLQTNLDLVTNFCP